MRAILRSPAVIPLLFIAIPAAAILYYVLTGADQTVRVQPLDLAAHASLYAGIVLFFVVILLGVTNRNVFDERLAERRLTFLLVAYELLFAGFAFGFALLWPGVGLFVLAVEASWVLVWLPRATRTFETVSGVTIQCDPAVVFPFVADMQNDPLYIPGVEAVEKTTGGPVGPGTQYQARVRIGRTEWDGIGEIVDYEPNTRVTSRVNSSARPNFEVITFELVPGGTQLTHRFNSEVGYTQAVLGSSLFRWRLKRRMVARRQVGWAKLKQILEGVGD
jgi:carbon monoxide dehydrogenase subunit G